MMFYYYKARLHVTDGLFEDGGDVFVLFQIGNNHLNFGSQSLKICRIICLSSSFAGLTKFGIENKVQFFCLTLK